MKSLGAVLRSYREKKKYSLAELSKRTRIREKFLVALEEDDATNLPAAPLVQGYLHLIATEIDLPEETAIALWRRDAAPKETASLPQSRRSWRAIFKWILTPRMLSLAVLIAAATSGALFVLWQWNTLSQPPKLEVFEPVQYAETVSPVVVRGRSAPDATVTLNTELLSLDPDGNFRTELALPPGDRTLIIQATDSRGRVSEKVLFISIQ